MANIPPAARELYNHKKYGYFGEFGAGANAKVLFIQSALSKAELDHITLIENIEGSERWDVQNLFQRDVDKHRVKHDILPYLRDDSKVKFFNSLTLAMLPLDDALTHVVKELVHLEPKPMEEDGHDYQSYEWQGYFDFRQHTVTPAFSQIRWNSDRVKLVAIDGQHRLSALKRWKQMPGGGQELGRWTIPVVIIGVFKSTADAEAPDLLEVVRRTFVYINSKAEEVNEARKILLNDESVNCVCTQALVQDAHKNDVQEVEDRDEEKAPLLIYNWRGVAKRHSKDAAPAALFSTEEVHGWFSNYILGDDGSDQQKEALGLDDMIPPVESVKSLSHSDAERVRDQCNFTVLPGVNYLLQNFGPTKAYINQLRDFEKSLVKSSDVERHALMKIRFGASREPEELIEEVRIGVSELRVQLEARKEKSFDQLLRRDIGMRSVISAFGDSKRFYDEDQGRTTEWLELAKWFAPKVDSVHREGWFRKHSDQAAVHRKLLTHICFDEAGSIVNYKFHQVRDGFGALILLFVFRGEDDKIFLDVWDEVKERLTPTLRRGFRSSHRRDLQTNFQGTHQEFKDQVNKKAAKSTQDQLKEIAAFAEVPLT